MPRQTEVALTEPQEYFVFSEAKYPGIIGGLGSGKSQGGVERALYLMGLEKKINVGYYMPTYDLIKRRVMPGFEEALARRGLKYRLNKSDFMIEVPKLRGEIYFRSYDNPGRIIAYEHSHAIVDELDTLDKERASEVWRKIQERNRGVTRHPKGNTTGNVSTPDQGYSGFTYERWGHLSSRVVTRQIDEAGRYELIRAPTYSNPCIPGGVDAYVEQIRENYDPLMAEMYIEGFFVSLTANKVYHFFDRKKLHTNRTLTDSDRLIHVSIDFNVGGCCSVIWIIHNNIPYAIREFVSQNTHDFITRLGKLKKIGKDERKIVVYPDASGDNESTNASASDIALIRQAGYSVDVANSNPPIRDRVNAMNGGFAHERIRVNTNECALFTDALETQGYDKKGKPEKFDKHPSIDDWNDSAGYFIHRKFPVVRHSLVSGIGMAR